MLAPSGSLVFLDLHKKPKVFWKGAELPVESLLASKGEVLLRVKRGVLSSEILAELSAEGINVKEIQWASF